MGQILPVLQSRAEKVLTVAVVHGHRSLVLGAWGCGVFGNAPQDVAEAFGDLLSSPGFRGAFDLVVFAIHERAEVSAILQAFQGRVL